MRANVELLNGEPMDPLDILRKEIAHLGQKFEEEIGERDKRIADLEADLATAREALGKARSAIIDVLGWLEDNRMGIPDFYQYTDWESNLLTDALAAIDAVICR